MQKDVSASGTIKADTFFPRIWRQGRNYSTIVGWLLYRAFTGRHWQLAIAVVLSLLHLSTQVAAIYVVYWYGKQMEQTGLVTVPFLDINVNGCGPSSRSRPPVLLSARLFFIFRAR